MPYDIVDAEVALEHEGVTVYHVYKNDFMTDGERYYLYSLEPCNTEDESFDVRELNNLMGNPVNEEDCGGEDGDDFPIAVMKLAIDRGIITEEMDDSDMFDKMREMEEKQP